MKFTRNARFCAAASGAWDRQVERADVEHSTNGCGIQAFGERRVHQNMAQPGECRKMVCFLSVRERGNRAKPSRGGEHVDEYVLQPNWVMAALNDGAF